MVRRAAVVGVLLLVACGGPADELDVADGPATNLAPATTVPPVEPTAETTSGTFAPMTTAPPQGSPVAALQTCSDVPDLVTEVIGDDPSGMGPDPVFMGVLQTYAAEHPDTFAGIWLDREASGTVVLAFTDDPGQHREALAARPPSPDDEQPVQPAQPITDDRPIGEWGVAFDVVQATYSEAELREVADAVLPALVEGGWTDIGVGSNPIENRVVLLPGRPVTVAEVGELSAALAAATRVETLCLDGEIADTAPVSVAPGTPLDVIVLAGTDGTYPPDTPVECGGIASTLGALQSRTPVEEAEAAFTDVIATVTDGPMGDTFPDDGWFVLMQDGETATLGVVIDGGVGYVFTELGRNGWIATGGGSAVSCTVRRQLPPGLGSVEWVLDPAFPAPGPDATELHVLATERSCTGGSEPGERLLGPQVVETPDAVRIAFAVIPLTGAQACPSNPSTPVTITLATPLGDRPLLDGLAIAPLADLLTLGV